MLESIVEITPIWGIEESSGSREGIETGLKRVHCTEQR